MKNDVVEVQVKGVLPTTTGCAVFVGNDEKTFVIYVDHSVGAAITMFLRNTPKERPLTHDLIGHIFTGLGVKVERIIINDLKNSTYYARLVLRSENELGKKILEIDSRPSDCIALAVQQKSPIYVAAKVFHVVEDMSEVLKRMKQEGGDEFTGQEEESQPEPVSGVVVSATTADRPNRRRWSTQLPQLAACPTGVCTDRAWLPENRGRAGW